MNQVLYEIKDTIGLPVGHLGPGRPDALYVGSLILGHRIEEFLDRLVEMGALAPAIYQNQPENILLAPNVSGSVIIRSSSEQQSSNIGSGLSQGIISMTVPELRRKAENLGIDVPNRATKAEIQALINAKIIEIENAEPDDESIETVTNGVQ